MKQIKIAASNKILFSMVVLLTSIIVAGAVYFHYNCIDMNRVTDFTATNTGLQIYTSNGDGYYWER